MLNIFAHTFMTATRTDRYTVRDAPRPNATPPRRWLPSGHWWVQPMRDVDLDNL